jgi:hypothetical protein
VALTSESVVWADSPFDERLFKLSVAFNSKLAVLERGFQSLFLGVLCLPKMLSGANACRISTFKKLKRKHSLARRSECNVTFRSDGSRMEFLRSSATRKGRHVQ